MISGRAGVPFWARAARLVAAAGTLVVAGLGALSPEAASAAPVSTSETLSVNLPDLLNGCDPVGSSLSPGANQVLSLVLPSAYTSSERGTVAQANSFLVQAEVQGLSPLVVDYTIKKSAHWADGVPIGRSDFIATWKRGASGSGPAAAQYQLIRSITAPKGGADVVVTFKRPTSSWQALFSPLLPAQASAASYATCASPTPTVDLSGGPYVIIQSSPTMVVMVRNPGWWGTVPAFDTVSVIAGQPASPTPFDSSTTLGVDEASWLTPETLSGISSSPGTSGSLALSNRLVSIDYATARPNPVPLLIRQGLSHLLDRRAIISSTVGTLDPTISPATSLLLTQGQPNYQADANTPALNASPTTPTTAPKRQLSSDPLSLASRSLKKAGYRLVGGQWMNDKGRALSVSLAAPLDDRWALEAADQVKHQLSGHGIEVRLVLASSSPQVASWLRSGRTQMGVIVRPSDPFLAHSASWYSTARKVPNSPLWGGFSDKSVNAMVSQASAAMNAVTATSIYQKVDGRLWTLQPSLPIFTEPSLLVWTTSIDGISQNAYPPGTLSELPTWKVRTPSVR